METKIELNIAIATQYFTSVTFFEYFFVDFLHKFTFNSSLNKPIYN